MVLHEFTFPSADGKTAIHALEWLPEGRSPIAVLQISHGVAEYILRYAPFARYLTDRGFAVVGHDHLGHGDSAIGAAPLYFGGKGSWDFVVRDIEKRRRLAREKFPAVPYFLLGHSMGSFLARTYLIRYPGQVDGAVIMGTGQMGAPLIAGGRLVAAVESARLGEDKPSPVVDKLAFGAYNKRFAPNRTTHDWLSINPRNVDDYLAHPQCGGVPTTGLFREMLGGIAFIKKAENLKKMDLHTPVLFISGAMDPVGDFGRGVKKAYESFRAAGVEDVSLKLYPELRHEILNEDCRETVYEDIFCWLTAKTPVAP